MLEGAKLLEVALDEGVALEAVYHTPEAPASARVADLLDRARDRGARVFALRAGVLERVADTVTPQPLAAIVASRDVPLAELLGDPAARRLPVVVCLGVRDPGNLGAILRSADAAGCAGVVVCDESADVYNPKVVRASAGAVLRGRITVAAGASEVVGALRSAGLRLVATVARGGEDYTRVPLEAPVAFLLGNEASGLDPDLAAGVDLACTIPMAGPAESLNVAMTATVLCFEAARRRGAGAAPGEHLR